MGVASSIGRVGLKAASSTIGSRTIIGAGIGATIGAVGGSAWDYDPWGGGIRGAVVGATIGAGLGARKMGVAGFKSAGISAGRAIGAGSKSMGRLVASHSAGIALGAGIGYLTGPSDSSFANIAMGAGAGLLGSAGARYMGSRMEPSMKLFALGKNKTVGSLAFSRRQNIGMITGSYGTRSASVNISTLGAGASALFAPAAAHSLLGRSRASLQQNTFNQY